LDLVIVGVEIVRIGLGRNDRPGHESYAKEKQRGNRTFEQMYIDVHNGNLWKK
jgi:hypothetical protein